MTDMTECEEETWAQVVTKHWMGNQESTGFNVL